jgi:hypothetical protein
MTRALLTATGSYDRRAIIREAWLIARGLHRRDAAIDLKLGLPSDPITAHLRHGFEIAWGRARCAAIYREVAARSPSEPEQRRAAA